MRPAASYGVRSAEQKASVNNVVLDGAQLYMPGPERVVCVQLGFSVARWASRRHGKNLSEYCFSSGGDRGLDYCTHCTHGVGTVQTELEE